MKLIVFMVIFYMTVVNGRNTPDVQSEDETSHVQQEKHVHDQINSQMRHRRRPRQSFYNYNYEPYPSYNDYERRRDGNRRDYYNRQQEELLSQILNQIEEISLYVKKFQTPPPPPPPQIIYVPYPYPYPVGQCQPNQTVPNLPPRVFETNQNWGLVPGAVDNDEIGDGSRPINLDPIAPEEPAVKPPPVEHGTTQAGMTTARPKLEPGRCKAAILVCCQEINNDEKRKCFSLYGCNKTFSSARTCHPRVIERVIAEFAETYAPINET